MRTDSSIIHFVYAANVTVDVTPDIQEWFGLWLGMLFINGVIFQLPLVLLIVQMMGLADWRTFSAYRRHFIVGSVAIAAVLTPTGDAVTLALTMLPIVLLFEIGILLCRVFARRQTATEESAS